MLRRVVIIMLILLPSVLFSTSLEENNQSHPHTKTSQSHKESVLESLGNKSQILLVILTLTIGFWFLRNEFEDSTLE